MDNGQSYYLDLISSIPNLVINSFRPVEQGWDSFVAIVNEKYVFRFPRRKCSLESLVREMKILPKLRENLNIAIPDFLYFSPDYEDYSTSFVGYQMIPGEEFSDTVFKQAVEAGKVEKMASQLGTFLTSLHQFPLKEATAAGVEDRGDLVWWQDYYRNQIQTKAYPVMTREQRAWAETLLTTFIGNTDNFTYRNVLIHGDLGDSHILVDPKKLEVNGVIDFGDLSIGDYAFDFYTIRRNYGQNFLDNMLRSYQGGVDPNFETRMDFYRKVVPFYLIVGGVNLDKPNEVARGLKLLEGVMSD